jgi:diacylglycerol kinase
MLKGLLRRIGIQYAIAGLALAWREEINFKIEVICAMLVIALGLFVRLPALEFALVVLAISSVLAAETFNTALEELCDKFQPTHDPHIAKIKDLAAAAVLLLSAGAGIIGLIIFIPYL